MSDRWRKTRIVKHENKKTGQLDWILDGSGKIVKQHNPNKRYDFIIGFCVGHITVVTIVILLNVVFKFELFNKLGIQIYGTSALITLFIAYYLNKKTKGDIK